VVKAKPKVKKGKAKKVVQEDIPEELNEIVSSVPSPAPASKSASVPSMESSQPALAISTGNNIPASPHSQHSTTSSRPIEVAKIQNVYGVPEAVVRPELTETVLDTDIHQSAAQVSVPSRGIVDLSMIAEGEEEASSRSISNVQDQSIQLATTSVIATPPASKEVAVEEDEIIIVQDVTHAETSAPTTAAPLTINEPVVSQAPTSATPANPTQMITALPDPIAPIIETAPLQPVQQVPTRQVRSSWLSKALGTGTVPVRLSDDIRKSMAAPSGRTMDLDMIRKSLAPTSGLDSSHGVGKKRVSDVALDEEEGRRIKTVRMDLGDSAKGKELEKVEAKTQVTAPLQSIMTTAAVELVVPKRPEVTVGSIPQIQAIQPAVSISAPLPEFAATASNLPAATRDQPPSPSKQPSDIDRVTRALDEIREKAALKEAQRARTQSTTPHHAVTPGAGGFFRGLGRSLGLGRNAEEEAARLEKELKEEEEQAERDAREELERLMAEEEEGMDVEESEGESVEELTIIEHVRDGIIGKAHLQSTSVLQEREPVVASPAAEDSAPGFPVIATFELAPAVVPVSSPVVSLQAPPIRPSTPPQQVYHRVQQSTTPAGTPPRIVLNRDEAPAIGAREEKHAHEQGARMAKLAAISGPSERAREPERERVDVVEVDELDDEAGTDIAEGDDEEEEEEEEIEEEIESNAVSLHDSWGEQTLMCSIDDEAFWKIDIIRVDLIAAS
jgi:hypothetical protein